MNNKIQKEVELYIKEESNQDFICAIHNLKISKLCLENDCSNQFFCDNCNHIMHSHVLYNIEDVVSNKLLEKYILFEECAMSLFGTQLRKGQRKIEDQLNEMEQRLFDKFNQFKKDIKSLVFKKEDIFVEFFLHLKQTRKQYEGYINSYRNDNFNTRNFEGFIKVYTELENYSIQRDSLYHNVREINDKEKIHFENCQMNVVDILDSYQVEFTQIQYQIKQILNLISISTNLKSKEACLVTNSSWQSLFHTTVTQAENCDSIACKHPLSGNSSISPEIFSNFVLDIEQNLSCEPNILSSLSTKTISMTPEITKIDDLLSKTVEIADKFKNTITGVTSKIENNSIIKDERMLMLIGDQGVGTSSVQYKTQNEEPISKEKSLYSGESDPCFTELLMKSQLQLVNDTKIDEEVDNEIPFNIGEQQFTILQEVSLNKQFQGKSYSNYKLPTFIEKTKSLSIEATTPLMKQRNFGVQTEQSNFFVIECLPAVVIIPQSKNSYDIKDNVDSETRSQDHILFMKSLILEGIDEKTNLSVNIEKTSSITNITSASLSEKNMNSEKMSFESKYERNSSNANDPQIESITLKKREIKEPIQEERPLNESKQKNEIKRIKNQGQKDIVYLNKQGVPEAKVINQVNNTQDNIKVIAKENPKPYEKLNEINEFQDDNKEKSLNLEENIQSKQNVNKVCSNNSFEEKYYKKEFHKELDENKGNIHNIPKIIRKRVDKDNSIEQILYKELSIKKLKIETKNSLERTLESSEILQKLSLSSNSLYDKSIKNKDSFIIKSSKKAKDKLALKSLSLRECHNEKSNYPQILKTQHKYIFWGGLAYIKRKNQLATTGKDGHIQIWDLEKYNLLLSYKAHEGFVFKLLYIEEKNWLVSCGFDKKVNIWDVENNYDNVFISPIHNGALYALEYIPGYEYLVSGGDDDYMKIWSLKENFQLKLSSDIECEIGSFCYSLKLNKLFIGMFSGNIGIFNIDTLKIERVLNNAHTQRYYIHALYYDNVQDLLISGSEDGYVKIWNKKNNWEKLNEFKKKEPSPNDSLKSFVVMFDKDLIIEARGDKELNIIRISNEEIITSIQCDKNNSRGEAIIYLEDRRQIVAGFNDEVYIWPFSMLA